MGVKVREAIQLVETDGWYLARTRGSHRHFKHPQKPGIVTIAGHLSVDIPRGSSTVFSSKPDSKIRLVMRYTIVIERGPASYGAYVPDLPGCVAAAETQQEVLRLIREAIPFHLEAMCEEAPR